MVREPGCPDCRGITSGDCGKHGPLVIGKVTFAPASDPVFVSPTGWVPFGVCPDCKRKDAEIAELLALVKRLEQAAMRLGLSRGGDNEDAWATALNEQFRAIDAARAVLAKAEGR